MSYVIKGRLAAVVGALVLAAAGLAVWGAARGEADGADGGKPAEMAGGGWVAAGDGGVGPQFQVALPCPGEDAGFNPQPDPPGHERARLSVNVGDELYELDELTGATCTIGDLENREGATHEGSGLASCGGESGFVINWRLTDAGIGNPDTAQVTVRGPGATAACSNNLHVAGALGGGNLEFAPATAGREGGA